MIDFWPKRARFWSPWDAYHRDAGANASTLIDDTVFAISCNCFQCHRQNSAIEWQMLKPSRQPALSARYLETITSSRYIFLCTNTPCGPIQNPEKGIQYVTVNTTVSQRRKTSVHMALGMCTADALRFEMILFSIINPLGYTAGDHVITLLTSTRRMQ